MSQNTRPLPAISDFEAATLHIVPALRWEREGDESHTVRQARLLDTVERLLPRIRARTGGGSVLVLAGQTAVVEDLAAARLDLTSQLLNHASRLEIGPWHINVDTTLVSGESLIRNLLYARADAEKFGFQLATVLFAPEIAGHTAQLPQLLRGFGIHAALLHHGAPVVHLPFRWDAPDGSSILVVSYDTPAPENTLFHIRRSVLQQRNVKPDGPFLWLTEDTDLPEGLDIPFEVTSLAAFVSELRDRMPDSLRPALRGELRLQTGREGGYLLTGTHSARLYLKQTNARLQSLLTAYAEPLTAFALTHGKLSHPDNARALLHQSWRDLLQNQARPTLGGFAADSVHTAAEHRAAEIEERAEESIRRALAALPGTPHVPGTTRAERVTYLMVWNPHNWSAQRVVEVPLELPPGHHPARLLTPDGSEALFGWNPETGVLNFRADTPPVGYAAYTLELDTVLPPTVHLTTTTTAATIASDDAVLSGEDNRLTWRYASGELVDVLRFYDGGDAGDCYNYSPPVHNVIEQADLVGKVQVESSALYERLIFQHRMRVAPGLRPDRTRDRGVRLLALTTTATFYDGMPGVYFHTEFENTAADHRLRAHLKTGVTAETVLSDSAFSLVARRILPEPVRRPAGARTETYSPTNPLHTFAAVQAGGRGVALLARGLPEFEAIPGDGGTTFALTLVRAVGWTTRDDLQTRSGAIGRSVAVPGAQCLRPIAADYALMPYTPGDHTSLLRAGQTFNTPLRVVQYDTPPEKRRHSYLSIMSSVSPTDSAGIILTTLKPPQAPSPQGTRGWVLRLLNITNTTIEAQVNAATRPRSARLLTLAEGIADPVRMDANGSVTLALKPHQLVTLRLDFEV